MTIDRAVLQLVLPMLLASCLVQPAAAKMEKIIAAGIAKTCTLTIDDSSQPCTNYTFLTRPDGEARLFISADPKVLGFVGPGEGQPTQNPFVFTVAHMGQRIGDDAAQYDASGRCEVHITRFKRYRLRLSSVECSSDSELGHISVAFEGADIDVNGY